MADPLILANLPYVLADFFIFTFGSVISLRDIHALMNSHLTSSNYKKYIPGRNSTLRFPQSISNATPNSSFNSKYLSNVNSSTKPLQDQLDIQ